MDAEQPSILCAPQAREWKVATLPWQCVQALYHGFIACYDTYLHERVWSLPRPECCVLEAGAQRHMSGPIFIVDAQGQPLMPMAPAYARKLVQRGKAHFLPHHAFTLLQLAYTVPHPQLRPIIVAFRLYPQTAQLFILAMGERTTFSLLSCMVDLRSNLTIRMRRRAGHRRRRRSRGRYRKQQTHGVPFKLRRPSLLRSSWAKRLRSRRLKRRSNISIPATTAWRVQAVRRVLQALQHLMPISHIVSLTSNADGRAYITRSPTQRRMLLIEAYGAPTTSGRNIARCGYCLTTTGRIEVEHIVPLSRGGVDTWTNLTLACARCNTRKGDRTPEESGMTLRIRRVGAPYQPTRMSQIYQTEYLLLKQVQDLGLKIWNSSTIKETTHDLLPDHAVHALQSLMSGDPFSAPHYVVKPIPRPRKQRYTARQYPKTTPLQSPYQRVHGVIRRQIRVNQGLAIWIRPEGIQTEVIPLGAPLPQNATGVIRLGMLCEGRRSHKSVLGIVSAIHSTGRLTLSVPDKVTVHGIIWKRVIVVPRIHMRIVSNEGVIFFKLD